MKCLLFFILLITYTSFVVAQHPEEKVIRELESLEKEAILKSDTVSLSKLMSSRIIVQNPENKIVNYNQIIQRIKEGKINYSKFERIIEKFTFLDSISVVMGSELVILKRTADQTEKTINRRFTNIWMKESGKWKLIARQATKVD